MSNICANLAEQISLIFAQILLIFETSVPVAPPAAGEKVSFLPA
jgi:hypothetical protein